jgi:hypothetical protein
MKEIRKTEKKKKKRNKNMKRGRGNPFDPASETAHGPAGQETRNGIPGLRPLSPTAGSTRQTSLPPPAVSSGDIETAMKLFPRIKSH